ncbi:MAG: nucleotide pyrophosphohydrolase [Bacteroidales bacterium]
MDSLSLNQLQVQVDEWIQTKGVRYFSELTNLGVLMEEVGELARIITRKYGDQSFKANEKEDVISEEIADVLFVLVCLANQTGVNLQEAMHSAFIKRNTRDAERHKNNPKLKSKR